MKSDLIRVLSIRQPWASMLMLGFKSSEIRTMPTHIRGLVAIHASKSKPSQKEVDWLRSYGYNVSTTLSKGVILGTISLTGCTKIESKGHFRSTVDAHMNNPDWYKDGLYAWEMEDPKLLDIPIEYTPLRGAIVWSHRKGVIA
jgi:hypothetical protein